MVSIPTDIVALIIGAFLLLFGYRVKKIAITIIWFIVGYWLVSLFVDKIVADQLWQFILCCVGGLVLGMFGMTIEKFAVFVTVGATFGMSVIQNFGPATDWTLPAIAVAVGVVTGVIAVWLIKPMIILATSIEGARLVIISILSLLGWAKPEYYLVIFLAVAAVGIIFQWNNCRRLE
ncbi:DUF4203 domain-containing protein [Candidatus Saccharibacteria bacterium]|nr:DUF4203 domain-containing protein [Candidatus Saccharibacteria bacterium]